MKIEINSTPPVSYSLADTRFYTLCIITSLSEQLMEEEYNLRVGRLVFCQVSYQQSYQYILHVFTETGICRVAIRTLERLKMIGIHELSKGDEVTITI
jgi:hypothetical protein